MLIPILLVLSTSAILVVSGLRKQPGIGVIVTLVVIAVTVWLRGDGLSPLGSVPPQSWPRTVLLSIGLGLLIQLISISLVEPFSERLTGEAHDHSIVEGVKSSWLIFLQWIVVVWVLVAILEEVVYRGFLMTETAKIVGSGATGVAVNVVFTSAVFGLSHGYQNRAGIISTGLIGAVLALIFVFSGYNLWLAILTHGVIDTVAITLIALDWDRYVRELFVKTAS